ncbi:MAG: ATP-binding protein [Bacteroidota bacterium]
MTAQDHTEKVRLLRGVEIFSELRRPLLEELASRIENIKLSPRENLIQKGERAHAMYVIIDGFVKVHDGDHEFAKLGKSECFGEYALIDPEVRNASVTAVDEVELFKIDQETFYDLVDDHPGFVNAVLIILIRRLRKVDELQKELADSLKKISQQKAKIEQQNQELVNLNNEKNNLMSIIAHDIRNPLTSSISIAETLGGELETVAPEYKEYTDGLIQSLWRINKMATDILEVSLEEEKRSKKNIKKLSLSNVLHNITDGFSQWAREKNIAIKITASEVFALLDEDLTYQVFENLISNAIKYSPMGKSIFLKVEDHGGKAEVSIKDQGPGFSGQDQEKMYQKFQQLSAIPTNKENSIGLGLHIVKKSVEQLNGEIELISKSGQGAHFIVSFDSC